MALRIALWRWARLAIPGPPNSGNGIAEPDLLGVGVVADGWPTDGWPTDGWPTDGWPTDGWPALSAELPNGPSGWLAVDGRVLSGLAGADVERPNGLSLSIGFRGGALSLENSDWLSTGGAVGGFKFGGFKFGGLGFLRSANGSSSKIGRFGRACGWLRLTPLRLTRGGI